MIFGFPKEQPLTPPMFSPAHYRKAQILKGGEDSRFHGGVRVPVLDLRGGPVSTEPQSPARVKRFVNKNPDRHRVFKKSKPAPIASGPRLATGEDVARDRSRAGFARAREALKGQRQAA